MPAGRRCRARPRDAALADRAMADDDAGARATRRLPRRRELLRGLSPGGAAERCVAGHGGRPMIGPNELARLQSADRRGGGGRLAAVRLSRPQSDRRGGARCRDRRQPPRLRADPASGPPMALVHAIDDELWRGWPSDWPKRVWVTRDRLTAELGALVRGKRLAVDYSPHGAIPYLDGVPAGVRGAAAGPRRHARDVVGPRYPLLLGVDAGGYRLPPAGGGDDRDDRTRRDGAGRRRGGPRRADERAPAGGVDPRAVRPRGAGDGERSERELGPERGPDPLRPDRRGERADRVRARCCSWTSGPREPGGIYADQTWMAAIGEPGERDARLWRWCGRRAMPPWT